MLLTGGPVSTLLRRGSDSGAQGGKAGEPWGRPACREGAAGSTAAAAARKGGILRTAAENLLIYLLDIRGRGVGGKAEFPDLGAAPM